MIKTTTSNTKNNFNNRLIDVDFIFLKFPTKLWFTLLNNVYHKYHKCVNNCLMGIKTVHLGTLNSLSGCFR